ncbi:hypothetical protein MASR1M107_13710 [Ignavibacteriales bacterium]
MNIFIVIGIIFLSTFVISFLVAGLIKLISLAINFTRIQKEKSQDVHEDLTVIQSDAAGQESELEVVAAIGLAIHQYLEDMHDYEKTVMTIRKVVKPYSPWSSKIYGLRQNPKGR